MKKRQIVNIVNFIRAVEPRLPMDLETPVKEQIALLKKHNLKATFLLQYDALIMPFYQDLLKELDTNQFEIGVWYEITQPHVEAANLTWRGRYSWDWHTDTGFSVGYTKEEREKLIDVLFSKFHEVFGFYPKTFGSWLFDSHTANYAYDRYKIDALMNCKEQFGTDGYTLWGGYYGQGYYPNRKNVFLPATEEENRLNVPLFRMLGSDPVYQYDYKLDENAESYTRQDVISLEPVYPGCGGNPKWIDWYMKENFNGDCLSFGYAQAGQENSFGWEKMKDGLNYQFPLFEKLQNEGKITVETVGETGRWYKKEYSDTPASAITCHSAFDDEGKNSLWYSSKFFRVNIYSDEKGVRIRDLHIYSDSLKDPFLDSVCTENCATYEALPFIDGCRFTGKGVRAGGFITFEDGSFPENSEMKFTDLDGGSAKAEFSDITITLTESGMKIEGKMPFTLKNAIGIECPHSYEVKSVSEKELTLSFSGVSYKVKLTCGCAVSEKEIKSDGNTLSFDFRN